MGTKVDERIRAKNNRANSYTAAERAQISFTAAFSNLVGAMGGSGAVTIERLSIRQRAAGNVIAVAAGYSNVDGGPVVAFGSGRDMWHALKQLNGEISQGRWKEDRYRVGT